MWLRLEPELDEEQEIEPERVTRGVIAAARAASPNATRTDNALTGPAQPRRAKPAETAAAEAGEEDQADRAANPRGGRWHELCRARTGLRVDGIARQSGFARFTGQSPVASGAVTRCEPSGVSRLGSQISW